MAGRESGFENRQRRGITRYIVWTVLACLALGAFLYADGYFDGMIDGPTTGPGEPVVAD